MQNRSAELSAEPTDRLGFDVMTPASVAASIGDIVRSLSVDLGAAGQTLWGRPLAADRLHVRIAHLGDYPGLPAALVADAIAAAQEVRFTPFDVTFDRIGSFTGRARNRPLALQGGAGLEGLKDLAATLHQAMGAHKLSKWAKPYTPHITVLYDNHVVAERPIPPVVWRVDSFQLTRSLLGKGVLQPIERWRAV